MVGSKRVLKKEKGGGQKEKSSSVSEVEKVIL